MKKIKNIFFDFDGVILESSEIKTDAFLELFKEYPQHKKAIYDHHINNMGISRYEKFEWYYLNLFKKPLSKELMSELGDKFSDIVFKKVMVAPFVPGARELLAYMKKNGKSFVVSGTPEVELKIIVKERFLDEYFMEVCGSPRTKVDIVEELLLKYDLKREDCAFVGDASSDWKAAQATGLRFIARGTPAMMNFWQQQKATTVDDLMEIVGL